MIRTIVKKELKEYLRDGRILTLAVLILGLGSAAALHGRSTVNAMRSEQIAAQTIDREVWNSQGAKNPHSAAHFSRYAFRPTSPLAVFDPGLTAYLGRAVWLEAHYRDPARLRPIDDAVEIHRFAGLSPAWILQSLVPLLIVLLAFSSIAGERERGTLRHVMSSGVTAAAVFWGKTWAVLLALAAFIPVIVAGVSLAGVDRQNQLTDSSTRLAALVAVYAAYLVGFTFAALGISARSRQSKTALIALLGVWVVSTVIAPRLSADVSEMLFPAPKGTDFWAQLKTESSTAFWSKEAKPKRDQIRDDLLKKYGVESVDKLPINFDGYLLQASEEFANDVFDRRYGELATLYERQNDFGRIFGLISPTVAVARVSSALAGTDLYAHQHFVDAAERFRRRFIKILNQDMISNAGAAGYGYMADESLWKQTPDFDYATAGADQVWKRAWPDVVILGAWVLFGWLFAFWGVRSSFHQEATS